MVLKLACHPPLPAHGPKGSQHSGSALRPSFCCARRGAECDPEMIVGDAVRTGRNFFTCHRPSQDMVVPPTPYEPHPSPNKPHTHKFKTPFIHPELVPNRTNLLFYRCACVRACKQRAHAGWVPS